MAYINETGIKQIAAFLRINHKNGKYISQNADMLSAWASDAEFSFGEGNDAWIEIKARDSVLGCTQTFTVSADGVTA